MGNEAEKSNEGRNLSTRVYEIMFESEELY